jgi:hypothetical protein
VSEITVEPIIVWAAFGGFVLGVFVGSLVVLFQPTRNIVPRIPQIRVAKPTVRTTDPTIAGRLISPSSRPVQPDAQALVVAIEVLLLPAWMAKLLAAMASFIVTFNCHILSYSACAAVCRRPPDQEPSIPAALVRRGTTRVLRRARQVAQQG